MIIAFYILNEKTFIFINNFYKYSYYDIIKVKLKYFDDMTTLV